MEISHRNSKKKNYFGYINEALYTAFATDSFAVFERSVVRRFRPGESVDVFFLIPFCSAVY